MRQACMLQALPRPRWKDLLFRALGGDGRMSETKWTPGKYSITGPRVAPAAYLDDHPDVFMMPVTVGDYAVCWLLFSANPGHEAIDEDPRLEPDGHLIAAAPDLYAALSLYLKTYDDTDHHPKPTEEVICRNAALAALRKARGESQ